MKKLFIAALLAAFAAVSLGAQAGGGGVSGNTDIAISRQYRSSWPS
jgi:hypothetical protein